MKRILFTILISVMLAFTATATEITIASKALTDWRYGGSTATLRIYANRMFITSDSKIVMPGTSVNGFGWYKEVTCAVVGTTITIPAFTLDSTTDSSVPTAGFEAVFFDSNNRKRDAYLTNFRVPHTLGSNITWAQVMTYNQPAQPPPAAGYYTNAQVNQLIASQLTNTVFNDDTRLERELAKDYGGSFATANTNIGGVTKTILRVNTAVTVSSSVAVNSNICLDFGDDGAVTVVAGAIFTINCLVDPGNRRIFTSSASGASVRFGKGAVERLNIAWWVGTTDGTDATDALGEAIASTVANGGGRIYLPGARYTSAGGHILSDATVIEGDGNFPSPGYGGTALKLASPTTTYLFKIGEGEFSVRFSNILLDGTGTSSKDGVLLEGSSPNTSGDLSFDRVTLSAFANGVNYNSLAGSWQFQQILFTQCIFQSNTSAGLRASSVNSQFTLVSTNFAVPANANAITVAASGPMKIIDSEFAGGGSTSKVMVISGSHGGINFSNAQDENFGTFLQNDASDISGLISITDGSLVQSKIQLNQSCILSISDSNLMSYALQGSPSVAYVNVTGGYIREVSVNDGVTVVSPAVLSTMTGGGIVTREELPTLEKFVARLPQRYISPGAFDGNPSTSILSVGNYTAISETKRLFRWGRATATDDLDYFYWLTRNYTTGRTQFAANQIAVRGYDFDADVRAGGLTVGTNQTESNTVVAPSGITTSGNARIVVTAAGMTGSPKTITIPVTTAADTTATRLAEKFEKYLMADSDVAAFFHVARDGVNLYISAIAPAANDATMNFTIEDVTSAGITDSTTSTNTTAGGAGSKVNNLIKGTATLDFPSISANTTGELTISVASAAIGGVVQASPSTTIESGLVWSAYVSAAGTVTVRVANVTTGAIDPASRSWTVWVTQ